MRSTNRIDRGRANDDLTTKARIRDTAIVMIGRSGFAATTVRGIAVEVSVSPALLLHHFGSKDGLRQACDDHILDWYAAQIAELGQDDSPSTFIDMMELTPAIPAFAAYIRRSLTEGGPFGRRIFETLVAQTQVYLEQSTASGRIRPTDDQHSRALLMVVTSLGSQMLAGYLAPPGTPDGELVSIAADRLMLTGLDLYTNGLFADSRYLDAYRDQLRRHPPPSAGPETAVPAERNGIR